MNEKYVILEHVYTASDAGYCYDHVMNHYYYDDLESAKKVLRDYFERYKSLYSESGWNFHFCADGEKFDVYNDRDITKVTRSYSCTIIRLNKENG